MSKSHNRHPEELLQWYANDTLKGDERALVESHLRGCAYCRGELDFLRTLQLQIKAGYEASALPLDDLTLRRLLNDIAKDEKKAHGHETWWKMAFAAALTAVVIQTFFLLQPGEPELFAPLSGPVADGAVLQVQFQPDATEVRIREVLHTAGATVIGGPSAVGLYRIRIEETVNVKEVIRRLQSQSDVVTHVSTD